MEAPLQAAVDAHRYDEVRSILLANAREKRSCVGLDESSDLSALQAAALYDTEVAGALIQAGVDVDLHSACALGLEKRIEECIAENPGALATHADHLTPMGTAILRGQVTSVRALLNGGDDPNRPLPRVGWFEWEMEAARDGPFGWTPLHQASLHGYHASVCDVIRALVSAGADLDAICGLGEAAIHLAATTGVSVPVLRTLVEVGADLDARTTAPREQTPDSATPSQDPGGHRITPLMVAVREGHVDVVEFFIASGADLDAVDSLGWTTLHYAARPWNAESVQIAERLVAAGALARANDAGELPVALARAAGNSATAAVLDASSSRT